MFHSHALRRMSRSEPDETYNNPIIPGFNPDPTAIRVDKDYFLSTSSFEYFPGAPIYHSTDLIQWKLIGHALTRRSQLDIRAPEPGGGVWATTLRYHNGWFYLTTCCWDRYQHKADVRAWARGFYVKTQNIWNSDSWSEPVYYDQPGFDQDLFWDDDGKVYLSTAHIIVNREPTSTLKDLGVHVCTIDLETGNSTSAPTLVRLSDSGIAEGSHIFKRNGFYYLFVAEGGTESGHRECVFRSTNSPLGPWEACPHNAVLQSTTKNEVQNTGHCDLFEDADGRWWAVCLAVRPLEKDGKYQTSVFGRETFLMPVHWDENDWPIFNRGNSLTLLGKARGLYVYDHPKRWKDGFESAELQLGWYWKNTPFKPESQYSLTAKAGCLRLWGGPYTLSSPCSPTALFRKQMHREGLWRTRLVFQPDSMRTEAGTVVYWNHTTYSSIGIRKSADSLREVVFRSPLGDTTRHKLEASDTEVVLAIDCQDTAYRFGFDEQKAEGAKKSSGSDLHWLGEASTSSMTVDPPIGLPFTGMMLGLYAFGEMERCQVPADFEFAEFL